MDKAKQHTGDHRDEPRSDELLERALDGVVGGGKAANSQQQTYLELKMTECLISSYSIG